MPTLNNYLVLSAILFSIGASGVFLRRNIITILLSIEIMLNAVNLTFVAFGRAWGSADGLIIMFYVMTVSAAEAAGGLAIVIGLFRHRESLNPDSLKVVTAYVEPSLAAAQPDQKFQFERFGYFVADRADHVSGFKPVFNRVTGLKDSWGK